MNATFIAILLDLGKQLDNHPLVKNGGIVVPGRAAIHLKNSGKECEVERSKTNRSPAESWQGQPAIRQRASSGPQSTTWEQSCGSRAPGEATPILDSSCPRRYLGELEEIERAYPGTQFWHDDQAMWLIAESAVIHGLSPKANFVVGIPFDGSRIRSWGFWGNPAIGYQWIGPRHTNFPDGSICAFDINDDTWKIGDPIVTLLDFYTVWALRHLHLQATGRWPGRQSVPHPYERILEFNDDEFCGCAQGSSNYSQCCKKQDQKLNQIAEAIKFTLLMGGGLREPPTEIIKFVYERQSAPNLHNL